MDAIATVANMIREAERHADDMAGDRLRAVEYYQGVMNDTPADVGRSTMVTRDVRVQVKKVLPSIMRTILGNDEVVEYPPVNQGDEEFAEQAGDYVNHVFLPESGGRRYIEDAVHDALLLRNGVLRWWWEEKTEAKISRHTGLTMDDLAVLAGDDDTEILEQSARPEQIETPEGLVEVELYDVRIRRMETEGKPCASAVPRERLLVHPEATSLQDSKLTGEKVDNMTRSDLVAMGYDRNVVMGLQKEGDDEDFESDTRRDFVTDADEEHEPNEKVDYYDIYVRFDADGDGIAELKHMVFAGGLHERNLLLEEDADEIQFCDLKVMAQPHQWEGISIADDVMDIQKAKTVLFRQTLDNLYWQNNPQPVMQEGVVLNPEAVFNPDFGLPIRLQNGISAGDAVSFLNVPFFAEQSFGMMEYLDTEAEGRTGVSDATAGLPADALQNVTAKASAMIEQQGIGQAELMVSTIAEGLESFFGGVLRMIVRHQDKAKTVRLRDKWVTFDPRHWNAAMDCKVNTGLGAGTRERDMAMMQVVQATQEKLLAAFGVVDNPFVGADEVYNSVSKMIEAAGLRTPGLYIKQPDPNEIEALMQQQRNRPDPEMQKIQAETQAKIQIEQAKLHNEVKLKEMEIRAMQASERAQLEQQAHKERAQMEADIAVDREKVANDRVLAEQQMVAATRKSEAEASMRREELQHELVMQDRELAVKLQIAGLNHDARREEVVSATAGE